MKKLLLLTPGDPNGIGPEVTHRCLKERFARNQKSAVVCVGAVLPFRKQRAPIAIITEEQLSQRALDPKKISLLPAPTRAPVGLHLAGFQSGWSIEKSVALIQSGQADGLVTGPISKEHLRNGGFPYNGHTDFLAALAKTKTTMMLENSKLRVTLVTAHLPLKKVSAAITRASIERTLLHTVDYLKRRFPKKKSVIAICGLNPHAGENGVLGTEEKTVIQPAIRWLQKRLKNRVHLLGPLPADTLFATVRADAVVAMYHDQGLTPVKLLDFSRTVNITLGLPFVRTSVDHGTAFDLVGKRKADFSSMREAILAAERLI